MSSNEQKLVTSCSLNAERATLCAMAYPDIGNTRNKHRAQNDDRERKRSTNVAAAINFFFFFANTQAREIIYSGML